MEFPRGFFAPKSNPQQLSWDGERDDDRDGERGERKRDNARVTTWDGERKEERERDNIRGTTHRTTLLERPLIGRFILDSNVENM